MEPGLDEMWDDGVCCTGILVRAEPEAVAAALGTAISLCERGTVTRGSVPDARAYVCRPAGFEWCNVEMAYRHVDRRDAFDYLAPLLDQAESAMRGEVAAVAPDDFAYETPVSLAAWLSERLSAPAIALWGSDECPELEGGAFLANGAVESAVNTYRMEDIAKERSDRLRPWSDDLDDEEEEDEAEGSFRWAGGRVEPTGRRCHAILDEALRERGAAFIFTDPLWNLAPYLATKGEGQDAGDIDAFWCAGA